jgi:hypothetical protein
MRVWRYFLAAAFCVACSAQGAATAEAAVPAQFVAKLYSEALGRAPDPAGWLLHNSSFAANGCSAATLRSAAIAFFGSAEYASRRYTAAETVLTAYRAILSREPDPSGLAHWTGLLRQAGGPARLAGEMAASSEFRSLVDRICNGQAYRQDWGLSQAIEIGSGTWDQTRLEACIHDNAVCSVPQRTVVFLRSTVVLPAGKVLQTEGNPDRLHYARQARIVRASGDFGHLLDVKAGAVVRDIWLSGQRHLFKAAAATMEEVRANIWYAGVGGRPGRVSGIRSDFPLVRSHIVSVGPGGWLDVENSLFTGYTSNHTADGTNTWVTDGISQHASNGTIQGNHIIDPTDVGIVIFGHGPRDGTPQATRAVSNVLVHAGLSAYGSAGFDTTGDCVFCTFTGGIEGNTILAGPRQHSDVMLFVGTAPWIPARQTDCTVGPHCGIGARMRRNRTAPALHGQKVEVQVGLLVDGMLDAATDGNELAVKPQPLGKCYRGPGVIGAKLAGILAPRQSEQPVRGCIGH